MSVFESFLGRLQEKTYCTLYTILMLIQINPSISQQYPNISKPSYLWWAKSIKILHQGQWLKHCNSMGNISNITIPSTGVAGWTVQEYQCQCVAPCGGCARKETIVFKGLDRNQSDTDPSVTMLNLSNTLPGSHEHRKTNCLVHMINA